MVELHLLDGLGNTLFQYGYARMVAEAKGYALRVAPRPATSARSTGRTGGPPDVIDHRHRILDALFGGVPDVDGHAVEDDPLFVLTPNLFHLHDDAGPGNTIASDQRMSPEDHRRVLDHPGRVVIRSWLQDYHLFAPHREALRAIFRRRVEGEHPGPDDVVMHMRLGDYDATDHTLPLDFHRAMMRRHGGRRVVCVTDSPDHPYVDALSDEPGFRLYESGGSEHGDLDETNWRVVADFAFLSNTTGTVVLSNSTFAWWAAYLSPAREVLHPLVSQETVRRVRYEGAMTVSVTNRQRYDPFWILDDGHKSRPRLFADDEPRWRAEVV